MKFAGYIWKRRIEDVLMYPFILMGRFLAKLDPLPKEYDVFYFFPFYHTGGAEQVHASIVKATGGSHCIIFFTRKSVDERFLNDFKKSGCEIRDISQYVDSLVLYILKFVWRGKISAYINHQQHKPIVFNGQSNFGYKISPWISKDVKQVELIHSFNSFSRIRIPFLPFIHTTVMISKRRIYEHVEQYQKISVPKDYIHRIHFIQNAINLPEQPCKKKVTGPLKALFVGRGTPEKRPELFVKIACKNPAIEFTIVGEMPGDLMATLPSNVRATGSINNVEALHNIYCEHHILIIPSETEGFPIVLMEAMARGCIVMATPVGDIPYHINKENGWLFSSIKEDVVISESTAYLTQITPGAIKLLSDSATVYAHKNFDIKMFNQQYKTILQR